MTSSTVTSGNWDFGILGGGDDETVSSLFPQQDGHVGDTWQTISLFWRVYRSFFYSSLCCGYAGVGGDGSEFPGSFLVLDF